MNEVNKINKPENKKSLSGKIKKNILSLALISQIILLNPGCKINNNDDLKYELEKKQMSEIIEQKENFSKLLYSNQEKVNGKKYTLIGNVSTSLIKYDTEFTQANFFDGKLKNTGTPHLTANNSYAYITYENNDKLSLIDTRKNTCFVIELGNPQSNISISAVRDNLYFYSKEKGLVRMSKDIKESTKVDLNGIKEIEGKIEKVFLNKSSRGLMLMGNNFNSIYFYEIDSNKKSTLLRLKLKGYDEKIENPRVVEYDKKYYIKSEKENFVLEFDYDGNFIKKMDIPNIE